MGTDKVGGSQGPQLPTKPGAPPKEAAPAPEATQAPAPTMAGDQRLVPTRAGQSRLSLGTGPVTPTAGTTPIRAAAATPAPQAPFSWGSALGHFAGGLWQGAKNMVSAVVEHPLATAGAVVGAIGLALVAPEAAAVVGLGLAAYGVVKGGIAIAEGISSAVTAEQQGDHRAAEQAFTQIGEGTFDTAVNLAMGAASLKALRAIQAAKPGLFNPDNIQLSPAENRMAKLLVSEGKRVEVLKPANVTRTADFKVNGIRTELKSIEGLTGKDPSGALTNRITNGRGQGEHVIVDARTTPQTPPTATKITEALARRAVNRAYGLDVGKKIQHIRIVGDNFDVKVPRAPNL